MRRHNLVIICFAISIPLVDAVKPEEATHKTVLRVLADHQAKLYIDKEKEYNEQNQRFNLIAPLYRFRESMDALRRYNDAGFEAEQAWRLNHNIAKYLGDVNPVLLRQPPTDDRGIRFNPTEEKIMLKHTKSHQRPQKLGTPKQSNPSLGRPKDSSS